MWNAKLHCTRGVREKGAQFWSGRVVIGLYSVSCMLQRNCLKDSLTQWKCHWSITVWLKVRYIGLIIVIILMHLSGNSDVIKLLSAYFTTNLWLKNLKNYNLHWKHFYFNRYTLLVGKPPFETSCLKDTYMKIKKNEYHVPSRVSLPAKNLIMKLLKGDPTDRPNMETLLEEEFFHTGKLPGGKYEYCSMMFGVLCDISCLLWFVCVGKLLNPIQ